MFSDMAEYRAEQAAAPAALSPPGFAFPYPGHGERRHQHVPLLMAASIRRQLFPGSRRTVANIRNLSSPFLLCVSRRQRILVMVSRPSCRASSIHMSHWMPGSLMATNTFGSKAGTIRTSGLPIKPKIQCTQPCTTDFPENMGDLTEEMANATAQ